MDPAFSKHAGSAPPFRVTLSPGRDMEGTSYESRFFIYEAVTTTRVADRDGALLFEDERYAALEALTRRRSCHTRRASRSSTAVPAAERRAAVSVRAAAVKKIRSASQRTSLREESALTDDDERGELLPAQGGVGARAS